MFKKQLTYEDFDGNERTETFYFNLSEAELAQMELDHPGGFADYVQRIIDAKNQSEIVKEFKYLLSYSYGEKSDDGRHFVKNDKIREDFESTAAYSIMFMELATDDEKAAAFVNGVVPRNLVQKANEEMDRMRLEGASSDHVQK